VTPKTLFYCASTSKAFTAAALGIMIGSGNYTNPSVHNQPLAWDTPVHDLIPEDFVLADPWATSHITLEDALSHRTGLPRHDKASTHRVVKTMTQVTDEEEEDGSITRTTTITTTRTRNATVRDGTRFLRYLPLNANPRTKWQYCNQMYVAATHVIETLTGGQWLGDLLRDWIWEPLGMRSTYFSLPDALAAPEHMAAGYVWDKTTEQFGTVPFMPVDEIGGAGSVISCVDDYVRWIRSLLREEGPLGKGGHEAVKTPRMIISPLSMLPSSSSAGSSGGPPYDGPDMYGLGWEMASYRGHKFWTHAGGMHAYGAEVFFFPDLGFGAVALGNTAGTSNYVELLLIWDLVDDKLGVPKSERYNWAQRYVLHVVPSLSPK
jgi:CubicO group peptidase (beta-lactamase class C family)